MNFRLLLIIVQAIYVTNSQEQSCGYMCSECDFIGNCQQCQEGFNLNPLNGLCQSDCAKKNYFLNFDKQQCESICEYGYYESKENFMCVKNQKCPLIQEFGTNQKQIINATLVGADFIILCQELNTDSDIYSYYLRIYDDNLNFKGEVQQLNDAIKRYYFDDQNNIFITCSLTQIIFWQVQTWKIIRIEQLSSYIQSIKYVVYLDKDYLIIQDQSEKVFTFFSIANKSSDNQQFKLSVQTQIKQQGQLSIFRGLNSFFYTIFKQPGFFQWQINFNNKISESIQHCNDVLIFGDMAPINDDYLVFGLSNNNLGVWRKNEEKQYYEINISSQSPISSFKIISNLLENEPIFLIAISQQQFMVLKAQNISSDFQVQNQTLVNSQFQLSYKQNFMYFRTNQTYSVYSFENQQLIQIINGNSQSPDGQIFQNIQYYKNQIYEFYLDSMFISQPSQEQQQSSSSSIKQYLLGSKSENINYYQATSVNSTNAMAIDLAYDGQLVVAGSDGSIRVYEVINTEDLSFVQLFAQFHPSCDQNLINQICYSASNVKISDLGYYYVIYKSLLTQFITIWQRNTYSLSFISDYSLDISPMNTIQNCLLQQNYLLIQNTNQLKVFDFQKQVLLLNDTYTSQKKLYFVTLDNLWGTDMIIYLFNDQLSINVLSNKTQVFQMSYFNIYQSTFFNQSFFKAQYFSATKVLAFNLYYNIVVYNFTDFSNLMNSFTNAYIKQLQNFCYHPAYNASLYQEYFFKNIGVIQGNLVPYKQVITGFATTFCGETNLNLFYYFVTPNVNTIQNTVYVMVMPNFQTIHVLSFKEKITSLQVDEQKLILYVSFSNGDIYSTKIIMNFTINLSNYSNVAQFFYTKKKNYFIIYQEFNIMIVHSLTFQLIKQLSTPNQSQFTLYFNEDLDIVILIQDNQIYQWQIQTGQFNQLPSLHSDKITNCNIDASSQIMVSLSADLQIIVWDIINLKKLFFIEYHKDDYENFQNEEQTILTFGINQMLLLQETHYLISFNTLNKIYIHDLINNKYFLMQFQSNIIISGFNFDIKFNYFYILFISDVSYTEIYKCTPLKDVEEAFSFKTRVIGSQEKVALKIQFLYDWTFIFESRQITQLDRQSLTTQFIITTFNPEVQDLLISYNLRLLIFWSDCSVGFCSPKVPIYSLDTGLYIAEAPYNQQTQNGMIIRVMIDENTNNIIIFKDKVPKIIVIFDLKNLLIVGLFSYITDVYNFPLYNQIFIEETANLVIYSGTSIMQKTSFFFKSIKEILFQQVNLNRTFTFTIGEIEVNSSKQSPKILIFLKWVIIFL